MRPPDPQVVNLKQKLSLFSDLWAPRVVAELNDYQFKVVKVEGEFVWHDHAETDEAFFVLSGELKIEMHDRTVTLGEGELFVVPKGVEHKPFAAKECHILLIEPRDVVNTGEAGGALRAENDVWV